MLRGKEVWRIPALLDRWNLHISPLSHIQKVGRHELSLVVKTHMWRLGGKRLKIVGRNEINEHPKFETIFTEGLQHHTWWSIIGHTKPNGDGVSFLINPRTTLICKVRSQGLMFPLGSKRHPRTALFEALTSVNPRPCGSLNWGLLWSVAKRKTTLRLPLSSMPKHPQV